MASGSSQGATGQERDSGHNLVVKHRNGCDMVNTPSDDAIPIEAASECSQSTSISGGQNQASIWTGRSGHYSEITGSMIAATKQVQHDPHWTGNRFMTGGHGEELDRASRPKEPPPILQDQSTMMKHPFPCKDPAVVIHISVLVSTKSPVPRALLTKESCSQLVVGTTLREQWQQNEHNLFIQAEREEVCLFRAHNKCDMPVTVN